VTSPIPTALSPSPSSSPSATQKRTAIIAGTAAAAFALLLLLLLSIFLYRRHRRKLRERIDALLRSAHIGGRTREDRGLLDGEDFYDDDEVPMRAYRDLQATTPTPTPTPKPTTPVPPETPAMQPSASASGSRATTPLGIPPLNIEEGPGVGLGLGGLVDSVMGRGGHSPQPSSSAHHPSQSTNAHLALPPLTTSFDPSARPTSTGTQMSIPGLSATSTLFVANPAIGDRDPASPISPTFPTSTPPPRPPRSPSRPLSPTQSPPRIITSPPPLLPSSRPPPSPTTPRTPRARPLSAATTMSTSTLGPTPAYLYTDPFRSQSPTSPGPVVEDGSVYFDLPPPSPRPSVSGSGHGHGYGQGEEDGKAKAKEGKRRSGVSVAGSVVGSLFGRGTA
ncbi:hypothetical protein H0H87_008578, partial [Tephrocybe sp. NHM501043]